MRFISLWDNLSSFKSGQLDKSNLFLEDLIAIQRLKYTINANS